VFFWMQKPAPVVVAGESGRGLAKEPEEAKRTVKGQPSRPVIAITATAVSSNDTALAVPPQRDNATQGQPPSHFGGPARRKPSLGHVLLQTGPSIPLVSMPSEARTVDACVARAGAMSCPGGSLPPRTLGERPRPQRARALAPPRFPGLGLCAALQEEWVLDCCPALPDSVPTVHAGEATLEEQSSKGKGLPQKAFPVKRKRSLCWRGERAPRQPTINQETDAKPPNWRIRARVDEPF
jgi:hypothetical protein